MRLPLVDPATMTDRQREIADRIAGRRGAVRGPFQVWLNSPELCEKVEALGAFCRFESALPLRLRELSLLIAARHFDAQYSWNAHVAKAVEEGIPQDAIDALARHERPVFAFAEDAIFYDFCVELLTTHFVSDATFARALEQFGAEALVDTIGSLGNFTMLGMLLNAFQVDLQEGKQPFPDVIGYTKVLPTPA